MIGRHEDTSMKASKSISQINTFVLINKLELCDKQASEKGVLYFRDTLSAHGEHLKPKPRGLHA